MTLAQQIRELREQRATHHRGIEAILAAADKDQEGVLTEAQQDEIEALEGKIADAEAKLAPLERQWALRQRSQERGTRLSESTGPAVPPEDRLHPISGAGRVQSLGGGEASPLSVADFVRATFAHFRPGTVEPDARVRAAMQAGSFADGGFVVPPNYVPQLIELLRPMVAVRQLGVATAPLINGSLTLPKLTAGVSANYVGESVNIPASAATGTQLKWTARKLAGLVPMSNELLMFSSPSADAIITSDIAKALAQREDTAFLRDDGTGAAPRGMRHWAPAGNVFNATATATPTLANIDRDLTKAIRLVMEGNVPITAGGWIFAPRTWGYLASLRDGNGNKAYPEMDADRLKGYPYAVTNNVPINLGSGNKSELYFATFDQLVVAEDPTVRLEVSAVAAYHDGSALQSAFSRDESVVRLIALHDFAPRHEEAIVVLTEVEWGA